MAERLGAARLSTAVHWITEADLALKGAVSYGGKGSGERSGRHRTDGDEVLVARWRDLASALGAGNYSASRSAAILFIRPLFLLAA